MNDLTYLTVDRLKDWTPISQNVDISQLENWIPVTETMHLIPILGTSLDSELKSQIETGTVTADNQILIDNICNASAWYSFLNASTFMRSKAMNKGIVQQFSENSQVVPLEDFKAYRQELLQKAIFFTNYLQDFLELNKDKYPLYRSTNCDGNSKDNSSGIWVG
jgi:hypothetical protein